MVRQKIIGLSEEGTNREPGCRFEPMARGCLGFSDRTIVDSSSRIHHKAVEGCGKVAIEIRAAARCACATHRPRYALPRKSEDARTAGLYKTR